MQTANSEHSSKKALPQKLDNPLRVSTKLKMALNKGSFEKTYLMEADFLSKIRGTENSCDNPKLIHIYLCFEIFFGEKIEVTG